jgi:hypothetical protein
VLAFAVEASATVSTKNIFLIDHPPTVTLLRLRMQHCGTLHGKFAPAQSVAAQLGPRRLLRGMPKSRPERTPQAFRRVALQYHKLLRGFAAANARLTGALQRIRALYSVFCGVGN